MDAFGGEDAALVLFDWLATFTTSDEFERLGPAEKRVLWDLESTLESEIPSVVAPDYREVLAQARARIAAGEG